MTTADDLDVASSPNVSPRPTLSGPEKRVRDKAQLAYRAAVVAGFVRRPEEPIREAAISVLLPDGDYGLFTVCKNIVDALVSGGVIADDRSSVECFRAMRVQSEIDDPFMIPTTEVEVINQDSGERFLSSAVLAPAGDVPAVSPNEGVSYVGSHIGDPQSYEGSLTDVVIAGDVGQTDFAGKMLFAVVGGKHTCDPDNAVARILDAIQLTVGERYLIDEVLCGIAYTKRSDVSGVRAWLSNEPAAAVPFEEFVAYFQSGAEPPMAILLGNPNIPTL
jgi:hypothetical protein